MTTYILKNHKSGHFMSMGFDNLQDAIAWANQAKRRSGFIAEIWHRQSNGNLSQVVYNN